MKKSAKNPFKLTDLPNIGRMTAAKLEKIGIRTQSVPPGSADNGSGQTRSAGCRSQILDSTARRPAPKEPLLRLLEVT